MEWQQCNGNIGRKSGSESSIHFTLYNIVLTNRLDRDEVWSLTWSCANNETSSAFGLQPLAIITDLNDAGWKNKPCSFDWLIDPVKVHFRSMLWKNSQQLAFSETFGKLTFVHFTYTITRLNMTKGTSTADTRTHTHTHLTKTHRHKMINKKQ